MNFRHGALALKDLLWKHRIGLLILFCGMMIPLVLLEDLMEGVHTHHNWAWDEQILQQVHAHASSKKDFAVYWATKLGYWVALPILGGVIVFLRRLKNAVGAAYFALTVFGAWIMDGILKLFFSRVRPDLWTSILPETSFSFPSGHSMISVALAFAIVVLVWHTKWRWVALVLAPIMAFLVGLSRIYLGVHYPSDVLGGWSAGLIWATGVYVICRGYLRAALPGKQP